MVRPDEVAKTALAHYGIDEQIRKVKEELFELNQELECDITKIDEERMIDEMADVYLSMLSLYGYFNNLNDRIVERIEFKAERLYSRIQREREG